ncbi:PfaD family polyunsaturated fatty acid/polyketide biosynthesis protein [Desulfococcaceae bacterium HSG9]|nr:PfaD family polyunsaturated fatty acid/polyketide biosynthesis protein [Desulfococcaceae bacterium HSG9]
MFNWQMKADTPPKPDDEEIKSALRHVTQPVFLLDVDGKLAVGKGELITSNQVRPPNTAKCYPVAAYAPALAPQSLGDNQFKKRHGLRYAYIVGAMANGITSVEMVEAAGHNGMLGFFGAAGLELDTVEDAVVRLQNSLKDLPYGFNLIHNPNEPDFEFALVELYLKHKVRLISASAYMRLTSALVYYRVKGIHQEQNGNIVCPNKIIAKVSRVEVAQHFFSPPPEKILQQLLAKNKITQEEAVLACLIPMADDLTAEADSGGHTDNRPAITLLPTMLNLRNRITQKYNYAHTPCVGLAGGIATPQSAAAAFAMGAAYILTGSVNQACVEAGVSEAARLLLAEVQQADVTMAPSADMFEMGVKVQVLKRGTMFAVRAAKLYELYRNYDCFDDIPEKQRHHVEQRILQARFELAWQETRRFFETRDAGQIKRALNNPKHQMALVFRSYLGRSSNWAITGEPSRKMDFQIWCGPAMGAFNEWVKGSFLEKSENRKTVTVGLNLLLGAAIQTRVNWLRLQGIRLPAGSDIFTPLRFSKIASLLED